MKQLVIFCLALCLCFPLFVQANQSPSPIIFIYDASGSMWGQIEGKTKMEIAADVLSQTVNNLPDSQPVGLVAYGHRNKEDCEDVEFLVDAGDGVKDQVEASVRGIKPLGKTPLAYSALQVIDKLRTSGTKATIILVTDGVESCGGNICEVIKKAKEEGIDFRLHIVGFGLEEGETEQLECAAAAGAGRYYDAADAGALTDVLKEATDVTVDDPADNFSVYALKNGQPIDAYVKAMKTGTTTAVAAVRTYADTALLYLPPGRYDLVVQPLENSRVSAVTVRDVQSVEEKMTHQTVSFDGGKIQVSTLNNDEGWDAVVHIYEKGQTKRVASGRTYGRPKEFELNPGVYDVEVTAMVLEGTATKHRFEGVEVKANEVEEIAHAFESGVAMIGARAGSELVDAVVNVKDPASKQVVAGGRTYKSDSSNPRKFVLTPGSYEVSLTAVGDHAGKKDTFTLEVKKGETVEMVTEF